MLRRFPLLFAQVRGRSQVVAKVLSSTATPGKQEKWDLYAGVLVERLPVVSKEFNEIENEFQQYMSRVEFEKSLKSNHELQHEHDLKQAELLKQGKIEVDLDESVKQTAQDLKDAYIEELNKFQFAPRTTTDDNSKNFASTDRCLDETLYLVVEHKLGSKNHLLLPQGPRLEGETMRQSAERILREKCGENINVQFYGNAPCGFYKYKYPAAAREQSVGAKVFFFRASLKSGNVEKALSKKYEWLQKDDLTGKLNSSYCESLQKFLF